MTIACPVEHTWLEADGAPMGVPLDVEIPSSTDPQRSYRIAREHRGDGQGMLIHTPPCAAWKHGRRNCRHVQAAMRMAEGPREWFFAEVERLWRSSDNWTPVGRAELAAAIMRAHQDATNRLRHLDDYENRMDERESMTSEQVLARAIRDFG